MEMYTYLSSILSSLEPEAQACSGNPFAQSFENPEDVLCL